MPANWRNVNRFNAAGAVAVAASGLFAVSASADNSGAGGPPIFLMTWEASNDAQGALEYNPFTLGSANFGTHILGGGANGEGGPLRERIGWRTQGEMVDTQWTMSWDCVVNEDPFVDATINVTNNSLTTQTFWVYMPLNIAPSIPGSTRMDGFVSGVVSDQNFDGAMMGATAIDPVYQAYIDNANAASMWNPGYALGAGPFNSSNDNLSFANQLGPGALNQIALRLRFDLSPGESASVTGPFEVQAVPGPAGFAVFAGLGALGFGRRRRA